MKRAQDVIVAAFFFVLVAGFSQTAMAEGLGRIDKLIGKVHVIHANKSEAEAREGMQLSAGDQIRTAKGGTVWFSIGSAGQFRLSGESQMAVDELSDARSEDTGISLRMILGYLTSKIGKMRSNSPPVTVHTTTATIGIRGTEFDTVAALDGSSAVVVDEGLVEVDTEAGQISLAQGKMSEVDADGKAAPPTEAGSREGREAEWEHWRQKREEMMIKVLPVKIPLMKARFEKGSERFADFTAKLADTSGKLRLSMVEFRKAKAEGRPGKIFQAKRNLRKEFFAFKLMVMQFRKGMNRLRISAAHVTRIKSFVAENKERFNSRDLETINSNLETISRHSEQLVKNSMETMKTIRQTFMDLKEMRQEILEESERGGERQNMALSQRMQWQ